MSIRIAPANKVCSGCDSDVPGHQDRASCLTCRGSGRESLAFKPVASQLRESRRRVSHISEGSKTRFRHWQVAEDFDSDDLL